MEFLPKEPYKKILVLFLYIIFGIAFVYIFFKYLLKICLPFIIAFLVSLIIRPIAEVLSKRMRISKKVISVILVLVVLLLLGGILFWVIDKLMYEFRGIIELISQNSDEWIGKMLEFFNRTSEKMPFIKAFGSEEEMMQVLSGFATTLLENFTANVPNMLKTILTILPNALFVSLILIMASYYFCAEYDEIFSAVLKLFPNGLKEKIKVGKRKIKNVGKRVLKGYLLTMVITFIQLYIGLLILKSEYAFTVAFITSLIDVLPVIGVGTVLIPWAIVKLILGSYYQGFGLLIIFAVVSVVREILEPKIIGKSLGLHPLLTLFAMYIGFEICGFWGLISFPVLVIALKSFVYDNKKA